MPDDLASGRNFFPYKTPETAKWGMARVYKKTIGNEKDGHFNEVTLLFYGQFLA